MRQETARRWLEAACVVTAAVGVGVAVLAFPGTMAATGVLSEVVFGEPGDMATPLSRLLAGITGGVLAGWGVTMWVVVRRLHSQDPGLVSAILVPGLVVWFVVDSVASVTSGGALNVVGNVGFLVMFGVPLLADRNRVATST
ncbi:MAG: hypothetical protein ACFCVC_02345 [Acidimicrobiia bacterium]